MRTPESTATAAAKACLGNPAKSDFRCTSWYVLFTGVYYTKTIQSEGGEGPRRVPLAI